MKNRTLQVETGHYSKTYTKAYFFTSFIQATVYSQTTIWQDIDYKNLKLKLITKIFSQG